MTTPADTPEPADTGANGQTPPHMDDAFLDTVTKRYVELYEKVTGKTFEGDAQDDPLARVETAVEAWLAQHRS